MCSGLYRYRLCVCGNVLVQRDYRVPVWNQRRWGWKISLCKCWLWLISVFYAARSDFLCCRTVYQHYALKEASAVIDNQNELKFRNKAPKEEELVYDGNNALFTWIMPWDWLERHHLCAYDRWFDFQRCMGECFDNISHTKSRWTLNRSNYLLKTDQEFPRRVERNKGWCLSLQKCLECRHVRAISTQPAGSELSSCFLPAKILNATYSDPFANLLLKPNHSSNV